MKCPTLNCPNTLAVHARRKYCASCRQSMAYHAKKKPLEILEYTANLTKRLSRIEHIEERKFDQQEAISVARRTKRAKSKPVRTHQERERL